MLSELDQKIVDNVEKHGWFGLSVSPAAESDHPPEWFTYTIGLQKNHGWPEIIVFGLDGTVAHGVLSTAIAECEAKAVRPTAGMDLTDTLEGSTARLVENPAIPFNYLGFANWYAAYAGMPDPPERLQLLWPDKNGFFPDDERCQAKVRQLQSPAETA
jgi:hypothetical protein